MTISMIGPYKEGLRKESKAWSQPEDSFDTLTNAYQWRDRIVRKDGYNLLGKLDNGTPVMGLKTKEGFNVGIQELVAFDLTTAYFFNGVAFVILPSVMPVIWSGTDYQFFFTTNYANAFWATNNKPGLNGVNVSNAVAGVGMTTITTSVPHGFTTGQTVALINLGGMDDLNGNTYVITVTGPTTFTIPFQSTGTYTGNGIALNSFVTTPGQDGIRYYGVLSNGTGWANYNPPLNPTTALAGALMIFPYRNYLVFLNTWEGNEEGIDNFGNRARWTQVGTPYYSEPAPVFPYLQGIEADAVRDDIFGKGGFKDAPTNEVIVSAGFIRDILIVYFERSAWRLRFVNNTQDPFVWERINVELGSGCTFSAIPFDKGLMAIGNRGIIISDGNDVSRFDQKIPDQIFQIRQANFGFNRVQGIRTFRSKLNYWTYPASTNPLGTFPDKILVFNYDTQNWSFFDDCFTTFGYYYPGGNSQTWEDLPEAWSSYTNTSWDAGNSQTGFEQIVAGNQQGYVFVIEANTLINAPSLSISNITDSSITLAQAVFTSINNNFELGTWITLSGVTGTTSDDGVSLNERNFKLSITTYPSNDFTLEEFDPINGGVAAGATYNYTISYEDLFPGSIQINIGSFVFKDPDVNGILVSSGGSGVINYDTGEINITFNAPIAPTDVLIRIVSLDPLQGLTPVFTLGTYTGGGEIAKISGIDIQTKIFNFFKDDKRARLSWIDFYVQSTDQGEFTCNVFADSGNDSINTPLDDNRESNVVLTTRNPYQIGQGNETIYRLFADCLAQSIQLQLTFTDQQMATNCINQSDIEINAMIFNMRQGGRLV